MLFTYWFVNLNQPWIFGWNQLDDNVWSSMWSWIKFSSFLFNFIFFVCVYIHQGNWSAGLFIWACCCIIIQVSVRFILGGKTFNYWFDLLACYGTVHIVYIFWFCFGRSFMLKYLFISSAFFQCLEYKFSKYS